MEVYCEFTADNKAWTYIQQRQSGQLSFATTWEQYKQGFGDPRDEFWIGNDNLHCLTTQDQYVLHIDMVDLSNRSWQVEYGIFRIDEEATNYKLHIDGYSGNATDSFMYSKGMAFSTIDRDNDVSSTHCAKFYTAGWWYKHCHYSNLNGRYTVGVVWFNQDFDEWVQLKHTIMKVRRRGVPSENRTRLN